MKGAGLLIQLTRLMLIYQVTGILHHQGNNSYNSSLISNITKVLDTILLNQDKNFRPDNGNPNEPLQVEVDISVRSMGPISEHEMIDHSNSLQNVFSKIPDGFTDVSILKVRFKLQRQQGFYILQIYTPCTLIVVMSWVSFWINKEASPARVALGIMTILSMSTLGFGTRTDLPKVSHSTALDIYIITCFVFVFAALVEYAIINYANIVYIRKKVHDLKGLGTSNAMEKMRMFSTHFVGSNNVRKPTIFLDHRPNPWYRRLFTHREPRSVFYRMALRANKAKEKLRMRDPAETVNRIDTVSKVVFPTMYILFNLLYWLAFFYWIPDEMSTLD